MSEEFRITIWSSIMYEYIPEPSADPAVPEDLPEDPEDPEDFLDDFDPPFPFLEPFLDFLLGREDMYSKSEDS